MVTKFHRDKLADGRWDDFVALQKEADALDLKHVRSDAQYARSREDRKPSRRRGVHRRH